jgi:arylamine N-acetyltransferase
MFSLDEYLNFLEWNEEDKRDVSLDTLTKLQRLHSTKIPFDNFDFHLNNQKLSVDPNDVWAKVKTGKRGTYCFEGNYLFLEALKVIGFIGSLIPV